MRQQVAAPANANSTKPALNNQSSQKAKAPAAKSQAASTTSNKELLDSQIEALSKYASRIRLDEYNVGKLSSSVAADMKMSSRKAHGDKYVYLQNNEQYQPALN